MITLPAYFTRFNRKADRSCNVSFETQEINSDQLKELDEHYGQFGWLVFNENEITTKDIPKEDAEEGQKTPSKRLRATLFILWKQEGEKGDFELFYRERMEKIINFIKNKLD